MKIKKYSKSFNDILKIKKSFFQENETNLKNILKINNFYKKQPPRKTCKNCNYKIIKKNFIFNNFNIDYYICNKCGHLNGKHEDSKKFSYWLYEKNKGNEYKKNYLSDYDKRVKNIYKPKVEFLRKVIKHNLKVLDIGCGGGHFLKALESYKIQGYGLEPSYSLASLGNKKLKKNKIINSKIENIIKNLQFDNNSNLLSLIGVLEHLRHPNDLMKEFSKSKIKYLFIAVPLFSISSFFENNFKNVFPRVLGGGHTHLFTKKSIDYMLKKYRLKIIGEWWFGSDILDLYRSLLVSGNKTNNYNYFLKKNILKSIDSLQQILDKSHQCNEVHIIAKKIK